MRAFVLSIALLLVAVVVVFGLRGSVSGKPPIEIFPDMDRQLRVKPQSKNAFFADGLASRPPVPGTVAFSMPDRDDYYSTGKMDNRWGDGIPMDVTMDVMRRGQKKYEINCKVCHGMTGTGNGIVSQYGLTAIANYHSDRFRQMADGEIFNTISNGKNQMFGYGDKISIADRWAVVAYVRALQRSRNARVADVPADQRGELK